MIITSLPNEWFPYHAPGYHSRIRQKCCLQEVLGYLATFCRFGVLVSHFRCIGVDVEKVSSNLSVHGKGSFLHNAGDPGITTSQPCLNEFGFPCVFGGRDKETRIWECIHGTWRFDKNSSVNGTECHLPSRNREWGKWTL